MFCVICYSDRLVELIEEVLMKCDRSEVDHTPFTQRMPPSPKPHHNSNRDRDTPRADTTTPDVRFAVWWGRAFVSRVPCIVACVCGGNGKRIGHMPVQDDERIRCGIVWPRNRDRKYMQK